MLALTLDPNYDLDLALDTSGLASDATLESAALMSLLCDARALSDDPLPAGAGSDRRGWCGDALADQAGDRWGSRLWLLSREKQLPETLRRAEDYANQALAWLITDGAASAVSVQASWAGVGRMVLAIKVTAAPGAPAGWTGTLSVGG